MSGRRRVAPIAVVCFASALVLAQQPDPTAVLKQADQALGASTIKSVKYSGTGFAYAFLQNWRPDIGYPKFYAKYSRSIDFEKGVSREDTTRTQFENPPHGGGGQPLYTEAAGAGNSGPNSQMGGGSVVLTPQGFIRAALAAKPTITQTKVGGKPMDVVTVMVNDRKVTGYIDAQHLVEKVETWVPQPTLGDMSIETTYSDYRDFNGAKFPTHIVQKNWIYPVLDMNITSVEPNAAVTLQAPAGGAPQQARAEADKFADGVWYLRGTPDPNSQLVEFKDFLVIVESSVTEGRALANIALAHQLVPGKPIKYHVNSHHHSDHSAGLRAFVEEGSTIITHEMNKKFYEDVVLKAPHTIEPDVLSKTPKKANFIYLKDKDKYVITDGTREMDIYHVENGHAENLLMSYLPKEKLLLITDIYNNFGMPRPNDPTPGLVSPYYAALASRIKELNLDVQFLAPSHGTKIDPVSRFTGLVQGTVQAPPVKPLNESR
jgi:glyoxylase-like metal-dependent hydrolase (beta-lactamase superfamily II)